MSRQVLAALRGISVYKNLTAAPLLVTSAALLAALSGKEGETALARYTDLFYTLRDAGYEGLGDWLWDALRYEDSPYPTALDAGTADSALTAAAEHDVAAFLMLAQLECRSIIEEMKELLDEQYRPVLAYLPRWKSGSSFNFESLTDDYRLHGAGLFAHYRAFLWEDGALTPVPDPDCIVPEAMLGYERQRDEVLANTRALLEGRQVNNVLLYGDSGTGKSATVKSMLAVPGLEDLRLIEVEKEELSGMPRLIRMLGGRRQKFILFIDDLTFDQDDRTYSVLKTILEGGLEKRPVNVAIYATSNRRRLIRQSFSERSGDEIDASETIQEKTSLSERFGLRIPYLALSRAEFLDMVEGLAAVHGVRMGREELRAEAVKWEMHHPGRTPRTARQFIMRLAL